MQKKPLRELLVEFAHKGKSDVFARNYAAFLENWEAIDSAHREGWSYADIWRALHGGGMVGFDYSIMMFYIRKHRRRLREAAKMDRFLADQSPLGAKPVDAAHLASGASATEKPELPAWPKPGQPQVTSGKTTPDTGKGEIPTFGKKLNNFNPNNL